MSFSWIKDIIDIMIVAYVIYRIILLIKGTRAAQMLIGFAIIMVAFIVSEKLELSTLHWILNNFLSSIVLVIIILFQDDIRRALTQVGRSPYLSSVNPVEEHRVLEEVVKASTALAEQKTGALIVLERRVGLNNYVEAGTPIDAKVTRELLLSIFHPRSPIHDGAVIIQKGRVAAAGCFLPLTTNPNVSRTLGTRHRAAIGLTEESDAVVIVVSEEDGKVSLAHEGRVYRDVDQMTLRERLEELMIPRKSEGGIWEALFARRITRPR